MGNTIQALSDVVPFVREVVAEAGYALPEPSPMGPVVFHLPFRRGDVYRELARFGRPLGADHTVVFEGLAGSSLAANDPAQVGCVRLARFTGAHSGYTVSECVQLVPDQRVVWQQIESNKDGVQIVDVRGPSLATRSHSL
eukprot:910423-Prymnesium_polylepis.1